MSAGVAEAKTEISQTVRDDVEEMVASINGALDAVQGRADKLDNGMETMKVRISESDATTRSRIQLLSTSLEGMISENVIAIGKLKETAAQQIQDVTAKVDDLPRQMKVSEIQQEEFRKKTIALARGESERVAASISELRDAITTKLEEREFDNALTEIHTTIQKLSAQMEIASLSAEHARSKLMETEAVSRERFMELRTTQEKALDEQAQSVRTLRETLSKRFEEMDSRVGSVPKSIDQAWAEIRKLKFELDEKVRSELVKMEKELAAVKSEASAKVSVRGLDSTVQSALTPLSGKLDRLYRDVEDMKLSAARPLPLAADKLVYNDGITQRANPDEYQTRGNIYKPDFSRTENNVTLPQISQTSGGNYKTSSRASSLAALNEPRNMKSDPNLERLADLAMSSAPRQRVETLSPPSKEY